MENQKFHVLDALSYGFKKFGENLGLFLLTNFIIVVFYHAAAFLLTGPLILGMFGTFAQSGLVFTLLALAMALINGVLASLFFAVFQKMLLDYHDTGVINIEMGHIAYLWPLIGRLLVVNLPSWLFIVVGGVLGAVFFGSATNQVTFLSLALLILVLLFVAGWIYTAIRLQFAVYAVIDKKMAIVEAWKASWAMTRGNIAHSLGLLFSCWIMYASWLQWLLGTPVLLGQVWAYRMLEAEKNTL